MLLVPLPMRDERRFEEPIKQSEVCDDDDVWGVTS